MKNYFTYLPESRLCESWGCTALSTGYTEIPPGSPYPPVRHPDDHHFVWEKGRTLQAYQFALISSGAGQLDAAPDLDTTHRVTAGDVLLLYPGVWHRFAPDPTTGWCEHWIELTGSALDRVMEDGFFPVARPIWKGGHSAAGIFAEIHRLATSDPLGNQPALSTLGLRLLAEFCQSRKEPSRGRSRLVERARRALIEAPHSARLYEAIAVDLGVSYSTLRRLFREETGMSMKSFHDEVRIRRACELLRSSDQTIKEVAGHLGFNSTFHFSAQFRKATGLPPSVWRERNGPKWLPKADKRG